MNDTNNKDLSNEEIEHISNKILLLLNGMEKRDIDNVLSSVNTLISRSLYYKQSPESNSQIE